MPAGTLEEWAAEGVGTRGNGNNAFGPLDKNFPAAGRGKTFLPDVSCRMNTYDNKAPIALTPRLKLGANIGTTPHSVLVSGGPCYSPLSAAIEGRNRAVKVSAEQLAGCMPLF